MDFKICISFARDRVSPTRRQQIKSGFFSISISISIFISTLISVSIYIKISINKNRHYEKKFMIQRRDNRMFNFHVNTRITRNENFFKRKQSKNVTRCNEGWANRC